MARYAAFLRGVSPVNARMPELQAAFESAGFREVRTVLASGNVVFTAGKSSDAALERKAEAAMKKRLGTAFMTIVRPVDELRMLVETDPYAPFDLEPRAKRVVTFARTAPKAGLKLPIEVDGACILAVVGREVFTAYVPSPRGPVFMTLIEKTFGRDVTTRTWDTIRKVAK
jgi:uncharacterized protein (DUF1697 family)